MHDQAGIGTNRTVQKFLSLVLLSLWKLMPGLAGLSRRSNVVIFTAFCSWSVRSVRLSEKVSAIRKSICNSRDWPERHRQTSEIDGTLFNLPKTELGKFAR